MTSFTGAVEAQTSSEQAPSAVDASPPQLLGQEETPEADGIDAPVVVDLKLTIEADGSVSEALVVRSARPDLDEAARAAVLALRFAPATRAGQPVKARTMYRYVFVPRAAPASSEPKASVEQPAIEAPPAPPLRARPEAPSPLEVRVQGERTSAESLQRSADAVTVVKLQRAKNQSADLGEVMARTFGVSVRRSGGLGSDSRFSLNGLQDDQVRSFLDGVPLELRYPFNNGLANVPVNLVERVEIYRGVVPVRFGADALGGAVNLVTDQSYRNRAAASYQVGSFGTQRMTAQGRYRLGNGFVVGADGFFDNALNNYPIDVEVADDRGRAVETTVDRFHDRYRAYGVALESGFVDAPWTQRLLLRGYTSGYQKQLQNNVVMSLPYGEAHYDETVSGLELRWVQPFARYFEFDVVANYTYRKTHFVDKSEWVYDWYGRRVRERAVPGEVGVASDQVIWLKSGFMRAGLAFRPAPGHAARLTLTPQLPSQSGSELLRADSAGRDPLSAKRDMFKLITGLEYQLDALPLDARRSDSANENAGGRLQAVIFAKDYLYAVDSEDVLAGGIFRERSTNLHRMGIGGGARWEFVDWLHGKVSYEYATRLPNSYEVFGDGILVVANLNLEPEVSQNGNVGLRVDLQRAGLEDLKIDLNAFWRSTSRQIVLLGSDRHFSYQNIYSSLSKGIEGAVAWRTPYWLAFEGSFTWQDLRNTSDTGPFAQFEGDRLPNRPWLFGSLSARLHFEKVVDAADELEPFYFGRAVQWYFRGWESPGEPASKERINAQLTHGVGISYGVRRPFCKIFSTFEIQNLTNERVYDFFGVQRPGRSLSLKLTAEI
ncbi:MAG: TonB-dependent siderophore myxochelin receptor MxcH [Polyangiaceae bacterium]